MIDKKLDVKIFDFAPLDVDKYTVQITDVGTKMKTKYMSTVEEEVLTFEMTVLDDNPMAPNEFTGEAQSTRGRKLWVDPSISFGSLSTLRKLLAAVYGHDLDKAEIKDIMENLADRVNAMVGKQLAVMVIQKPSKDGTRIFNNVEGMYPANKELEPIREGVEKKVTNVVKKTSPAVAKSAPVAPAAEDPDKVIAEMEAEAAAKTVVAPVAPVQEAVEEEDPEVALLLAEQAAADLAVKTAKAKVEAARRAAATKAAAAKA